MTDDARTEIRITGLGGQGVVLAAHIIGYACAIVADKHATMMQSFGPEARGSSCTTTLVVSGSEVLYPYVNHADVLVAMSAAGYETHADDLTDDGVLIYEEDLVTPELTGRQRSYGIPSTRIAEEMGRPIVQNLVMVGFVAAITDVVPVEAMREAVAHSVPAGTEEVNVEAFDRGLEFGQALIDRPADEVVARAV